MPTFYRAMPVQWNPLAPPVVTTGGGPAIRPYIPVSHPLPPTPIVPVTIPVPHALPPELPPPSYIGGTSSDPSTSGNVLSLNLGGGSFNYDIGPNTDAVTRGAYQYLDNSFREDSNLLGRTIIGSQNFLSDFASPLIDFNTRVLPPMFGTLGEQNFALGSAAVSAEADVARASVAASYASAAQASTVQGGGGGGCFITTAVCEARGEPDDGITLTLLRSFRDSYMRATPERRELLLLYYRRAPHMVRQIKQRHDAREFLERIFTVYIVPAREAILRGDNSKAFFIYAKAMFDIQQVLRTA